MKLTITLLLFIIVQSSALAQIKTTNGDYWYAKEFSKDIALFNSKNFLFSKVLGVSPEITKFEITPLAAASSGELTTLLYKCDDKKKEGLILGFFGDYITDAGVIYQGFAFRNLEKEAAMNFLSKIKSAIDDNEKYLIEKSDNNNIYFQFEDITVLITYNVNSYKIRLNWNGFDSTWEQTAFERSKKRFERKIK